MQTDIILACLFNGLLWEFCAKYESAITLKCAAKVCLKLLDLWLNMLCLFCFFSVLHPESETTPILSIETPLVIMPCHHGSAVSEFSCRSFNHYVTLKCICFIGKSLMVLYLPENSLNNCYHHHLSGVLCGQRVLSKAGLGGGWLAQVSRRKGLPTRHKK